MKIATCLVLACLASSALGGEILYPVPRKAALVVSQAFDDMSRGNVSVRGSVTKSTTQKFEDQQKTIVVDVGRSNIGPVKVECLFLVKREIGDNPYGPNERIIPAGQAECGEEGGSFTFVAKNSHQADVIKGWFIRAVKNGAVVGVAGSSEKYAAMAGDPATVVLYGQK